KPILTENQVFKAFYEISNANINCDETKQILISQINHKKYIKNQKIRNGICPKCGGNLVLRNGRHGLFYGCSNFPKCRFTINNDI
ncbi:MAG: topoisomerase DNA-binding C4 zinc finger domain-containing protein, partial [Hominimerdicola sp.]